MSGFSDGVSKVWILRAGRSLDVDGHPDDIGAIDALIRHALTYGPPSIREKIETAVAQALTHLDPEDENCPRCHQHDCSPDCIAVEQTEIDAWTGPTPRKKA